jgi:hypothetical protein
VGPGHIHELAVFHGRANVKVVLAQQRVADGLLSTGGKSWMTAQTDDHFTGEYGVAL